MQSATSTNRLSDRMAATAARLTTVSRRLTAAQGLSGFTIEELCEEVGVSRRTFFNYFPSKEDAVLGVDETEETERFATEFLALGSRGWRAVLDDFMLIAAGHAERSGFGLAEHVDFHAALEREPKLLVRFMGLNREREQLLVELIATREGVPADDPRARACADLFGMAIKTTMTRVFGSGVAELGQSGEFDIVGSIRDCLATYRTILEPDDPDAGPPAAAPQNPHTNPIPRKDLQ
ncbi:TetR/AcrR family transcriptional regulator [Plantibacter flavus]|uniref:TetR/AcrR family transcriptional regulator n=1 Tax=Plantibacter flavus TaxID=150123 RepID=UPI00339B7601